MANPIDRTWYNGLVDDDGSGNTGTVWNKAQINGLLNAVDASLAPVVANPSPVDITIAKTRPRLVLTPNGIVPRTRVSAFGGGADNSLPRGMITLNEYVQDAAGAPVYVRDDPAALASGILFFDGNIQFTTTSLAGVRTVSATINADGSLTLWPGRLQFPAIQNPSADPYTLDDYREGTWLPRWGGTGGGSGGTYTLQTASYQKMGNRVFTSGRLLTATLGALSGNLLLQNLPFQAANIYNPGSIRMTNGGPFGITFSELTGTVNVGATDVGLAYLAPGGASVFQAMPVSALLAGTDFFFEIQYLTTY